MTPDWFAAIMATFSLIVTVIGWSATHSKQIQLESIKGDIQKALSEHETRFGYLYNRRGEVIDELYKRVIKIMQLWGASARSGRFNGERSPEEQRNEALKLFSQLADFYYQNRLYLDQSLCTQVEELLKKQMEISINLGVASSLSPMSLVDMSAANQASKFISDANEIINTDLPRISDLIEKQMRVILGINHTI